LNRINLAYRPLIVWVGPNFAVDIPMRRDFSLKPNRLAQLRFGEFPGDRQSGILERNSEAGHRLMRRTARRAWFWFHGP
jgi:hypothetical protein